MHVYKLNKRIHIGMPTKASRVSATCNLPQACNRGSKP